MRPLSRALSRTLRAALTGAGFALVVACGPGSGSAEADASGAAEPSGSGPGSEPRALAPEGDFGRSTAEVPDGSAPPRGLPPWDLAIENARIVDGTGAPARPGGVLVKDGVLAWVGPLDADTVSADVRIDAAGRVLAPGFIDAHAHGDPVGSGRFPGFLAQGVTTILLGQDGTSPEAGALEALFRRIEADPPQVNVAYLAGHGTLRAESGLGFGPADADGRRRLAERVTRAMEAGAFGLSLGLEYDAGRGADTDELAEAARAVAAGDGILMSHLRSEDADRVEAAIEELLEVGRRSGARVHVSHLKIVLGRDPGQPQRMLGTLARARAEGLRVSADVYPYTASYTGLSILFPDWARGAVDYPAVASARRAELAAHLRGRVLERNGPEATLFATGPWAGRTLAEAADAAGRPFEELLVDLGPSGARAAYFVMDDASMTAFLLDPHVVVASDGGPGIEHPRGFGAFSLVLQRFVTEEGLLSLEEAVARMSGVTAALLGLDDPERQPVPRGLLRAGFAADLTLFDPGRIEALADFQNPRRLARGMDGVWVNGVRVWENGSAVTEASPAGPGRLLLRSGSGS